MDSKMPLFPLFKGLHTVEFINGDIRRFDLSGATFDARGHPIYIYGSDGTAYNYDQIISVREEHL